MTVFKHVLQNISFNNPGKVIIPISLKSNSGVMEENVLKISLLQYVLALLPRPIPIVTSSQEESQEGFTATEFIFCKPFVCFYIELI